MSKVYCAEGDYNKEFEIPWTTIGQTCRSIWSRLKTKPFGRFYRDWVEVTDTDIETERAKRIAVEALAHYLAAKKYGHAPRSYRSRKDPEGAPFSYSGCTETFKCELSEAEIIIRTALGYVELAWENESD